MGDLAARQAALEEHFKNLASTRAGAHVFALEHCLDDAARVSLAEQVRADCTHRRPSDEHWLVWTVYATEIGYRYAGQEYWQTFEAKTPKWQQYNLRGWLRECFERFHKRFGGLRPLGSWAERFSIICWPITHAILPRDLQTRVAKILYEVRDGFTATTLTEPRLLGEMIAARGWLGAARLEQLADDAEAIGSIALALLLGPAAPTAVPIASATIERIAADLQERKNARAWLGDARRAANTVVLRGLQHPKRPPVAPSPTAAGMRQVMEDLGLRPSVVLKPTAEGRLAWLRLPNLSLVVARFPQLRDFVSTTRATVAGSSGQPLHAQRLLRDDQKIPLHRWPKRTEMVLSFPSAPPILDALLSAECLLSEGPTWVFRIGSDGDAYELRGRVVQPSHDYLLLCDRELCDDALGLEPAALSCADVWAYRLRVPSNVGDAYVAALNAINVGVARAFNVEPAGLAAGGWSLRGQGEWLAGERPCFALSADHDVRWAKCGLSGFGEVTVASEDLQHSDGVFIELPALPVGAHIAEFVLETMDGKRVNGQAEILVRDRRPWTAGITQDGALNVFVDPPAPTLEDVWSDRSTVDALGPKGQRLDCVVRFWTREGNLIHAHEMPALQLPVSRRQWSAHFRRHCRLDEDCEKAYDGAHSATIDFVTEAAGAHQLRAPREFTALRWSTKSKQEYTVRLIDDRGTEGVPPIVHYAFETPARRQPLKSREILDEWTRAPQGLLVAMADNLTQGLVVAPRRFQLANRQPSVPVVPRDVESIVQLVHTIDLWTSARQVGSILSLRFAARSVAALEHALWGALGGEGWRQLEEEEPINLQSLRKAIGHDRLARELSDDAASYAQMTPEKRVAKFEQTLASEMATAAVRRASEHPRERFAEVALRFASDPGGLRLWTDSSKRLKGMVNQLLYSQTIARAARFLVLATEYHLALGAPPGPETLHSAWRWA